MLLVLTLAVVVMVGGCGARPWTIFLVNGTERRLVVRVATQSWTRDWLTPSGASGTLVELAEPVSAHLLVLDASSCAVLLEGDLPMRSTAVGVVQDLSSLGLSLSIVGKDLSSGEAPGFGPTEVCRNSPTPTATH